MSILERLAEVIEQIPSPCAGCENRPTCAQGEVSCARFHHFVQTGRIGKKPNEPTAEQYRTTFTNSRHEEMFDTLQKRPGHVPMRDLVKHYGFHRMTLARRYLKDRESARHKRNYPEWREQHLKNF